jgi:RNA polymerase sigma factor (TIGR02999 family)
MIRHDGDSKDIINGMSDVTQILKAIDRGDSQGTEQLLPLVYEELRLLAGRKLAQEAPGQTLDATALVHEAYLRLVGDEATNAGWDTRGHFFAAAAEAMRRILVENARRKLSLKRGGDRVRLELDRIDAPEPELSENLLALDEALNRLADVDAEKAELVKLRYFAGLTLEQAAKTLHISTATAGRYWTFARAWLHRAVKKDAPELG